MYYKSNTVWYKKDKINYYLSLSKSKIFITDTNYKFNNVLNLKFYNYENFIDEISKYSSDFYKTKILTKNPCVYYFSSGTTAKPKLIKYSNHAMINCQKNIIRIKFFRSIFEAYMFFTPWSYRFIKIFN